MLIAKFLEGVHEVETLILDPLPGYDKKKLKGKWFYEGINPLPASVSAVNAALHLPHIVKKDKEIVIRDRASSKVILAVYRNRIGPDVLSVMQNTVIEMFQLRRRVARSEDIKKLNQGSLTAAGYWYFFFNIY